MPNSIVCVTFEVTTGSSKPWYDIPKGVTKLLGLRPKDEIVVNITDLRTNRLLWTRGTETLKSDTEIFGSTEVQLQPGQKIRVEVSRPK